MNQEIKQLWIAALRSGEYRQARGQLRVIDDQGSVSYCCLGVLCDIHAKAGLGKWIDTDYYAGMTEFPYESALHPAVADWAQTGSSDPIIASADEHDGSLSALNDGRSGIYMHDFATIADLIGKYL